MSRKYTITLNEEQLMLVSSCVEDIHRFLCGDTTLRYAMSVLDVKDCNVLQKRLEQLKPLVTPRLLLYQEYDWAGNGCPDEAQRRMIAQTYYLYGECLTEGISLLTGFDNTYRPSDKESYSQYTFHFIKEAISSFGLSKNIGNIIRTIIFDALIGNSDRHQENWGFITPFQEKTLTREEAKSFLGRLKERIRQIQNSSRGNDGKIPIDGTVKIRILQIVGKYAPIYDSGCCLAREKSEEAVRQMINDKTMFDSFVNRGQSEIRWDKSGKKLNHFELIKRIKEEHCEVVANTINQVIAVYDENKIRDIVFNIDKPLPDVLKADERCALSDDRKELICRLIGERFNRLKNIIL